MVKDTTCVNISVGQKLKLDKTNAVVQGIQVAESGDVLLFFDVITGIGDPDVHTLRLIAPKETE